MIQRRPGTDRRGLLLAVAGCLASAAVILLASGQTWLEVALVREPPLPSVREAFTGGDVLDSLVPLGILVGAAGLVLVATGRAGRLVVGVVLVVAGILVLAPVAFFLDDDGALTAMSWVQAYEEPGSSLYPERDVSLVPAVFALLGGGMSTGIGIFTLIRRRGWPVMGTRYERGPRAVTTTGGGGSQGGEAQGLSAAAAPVGETAMWAAMERGEDPTATPVARTRDTGPGSATRDQPGQGR